jgi:hypothetical protein
VAVDAVERGLRFGAAIIVATLAAGPIFWFSALLVSIPSNPALLDWGMFLLAILTIPYAVIFAFLPILIGTATMTALGAWFLWARSFFAWIGAGGLGGALFAAINSGTEPSDLQILAVMALTGAACAAICRALTRWPDWEDGASTWSHPGEGRDP